MKEKIMAVDNEFEIIQLMRLHLVRNGYQVVWTTESEKALDMIREESPDLILLDVVMPGVNGLELCSQIREITSVRWSWRPESRRSFAGALSIKMRPIRSAVKERSKRYIRTVLTYQLLR